MLDAGSLSPQTLRLYSVRNCGIDQATRLLTDNAQDFQRLQACIAASRKQGAVPGSRFAAEFDEPRTDLPHNREDAFKQQARKLQLFLAAAPALADAHINLSGELQEIAFDATQAFDLDSEQHALIREEVTRPDDWRFAQKIAHSLQDLGCDAISYSIGGVRYSSVEKCQLPRAEITCHGSSNIGIGAQQAWVLHQGQSFDIDTSVPLVLPKPIQQQLNGG